jgi:hypothetical protein
MLKTFLIAVGLMLSVGNAMACTVQTIVTDKGLVSCYVCPNMPISCTKV